MTFLCLFGLYIILCTLNRAGVTHLTERIFSENHEDFVGGTFFFGLLMAVLPPTLIGPFVIRDRCLKDIRKAKYQLLDLRIKYQIDRVMYTFPDDYIE